MREDMTENLTIKTTRSRRSPLTKKPASPDKSGEQWVDFLAGVIQRCQRPVGERKQDRSKKRDNEILRAAMRVFARDGISRTRIGDIASEAGIPVSTLYQYYASKEEIAHAVPIANFAQFFQEYAVEVSDKHTANDRLRLYLWLAADFARRNPEWARVLYLEIWPRMVVTGSPLRDSFDDYVRIVVYLIKQGEMGGDWPAGPNPYETAAILYGSVNQIIITSLLYRRPRNLSIAATSIVDRAMTVLQSGPNEKPTAVKKSRSKTNG
jgi:hypothetical protein